MESLARLSNRLSRTVVTLFVKHNAIFLSAIHIPSDYIVRQTILGCHCTLKRNEQQKSFSRELS